MQSKHTPGPWDIITWAQTGIENESGIFISGHKSPAYHAPLAKILENNPPLTSTLETHIGKQEAIANARLIAAAPDLYEGLIVARALLQATFEGSQKEFNEWLDECHPAINAAIAKAEAAA